MASSAETSKKAPAPPVSRFTGNGVVVTGAAQRIGLGIAERFLEQGAGVIALDRLGEELDANASRLGELNLAPEYPKTIPLGHFAKTAANRVLFFASRQAAFVTGQTIVTDGGQMLGIRVDLEQVAAETGRPDG